MAEVLRATNGLFALGLCWCNALATSSLPVPDSPVISTVMLERDSLPIERKTSCMAGACPISEGISWGDWESSASSCPVCRAALRTSSTASSTSKGFGRYSKAPPW